LKYGWFVTALLVAASANAQPALQPEIDRVSREIVVAESENAKYSGGLVKALIESRIATLRQTRSMLEQRKAASDFNITLNYTADGKTFTPPANTKDELATLARELDVTKLKVAAAENEVSKYSGGRLTTIAVLTFAAPGCDPGRRRRVSPNRVDLQVRFKRTAEFCPLCPGNRLPVTTTPDRSRRVSRLTAHAERSRRRTTSTEQEACPTMACATLPSSHRVSPVRPWEPTTIRSALHSFDSSTMAERGSPSRTVVSVDNPAFFSASAARPVISSAVEACCRLMSSNVAPARRTSGAGGGYGCITDITRMVLPVGQGRRATSSTAVWE
jgi:hypothetical protein